MWFFSRFISTFSHKHLFWKYVASLSLWLSVCHISGEDEFSFAYDGRGKKVSGGTEEEFGEPFSEGDIIGCYAVSDFTYRDTIHELKSSDNTQQNKSS